MVIETRRNVVQIAGLLATLTSGIVEMMPLRRVSYARKLPPRFKSGVQFAISLHPRIKA